MTKEIFKNFAISSDELVLLLAAREQKELDFTLMDIRESEENRELSIEGTDILFPTSKMASTLDKMSAFKDEPMVIYCRSGGRTEYLMNVLMGMGFESVCHLEGGIIEYEGKTVKNQIPNSVY